MAKKKHQREAKPVQETQPEEENRVTADEPQESSVATSPTCDSLVEEVQSFSDRRAALAQKLADEIAATEKKLAELKKTAALLFPENQAGPVKDRKAKKLKLKTAARAEKTEPAASNETTTSENG